MFLLGYLLAYRYIDLVWELVRSYKRDRATEHIMQGSTELRELYELTKNNEGSSDISNRSAGQAIFPVDYSKRAATVVITLKRSTRRASFLLTLKVRLNGDSRLC